MADFFCKYCRTKNVTISHLTYSTCSKNPTGKHIVYEGDASKKEFVCKYCGTKNVTISHLTYSTCSKNPNGKYHEPL